MQMHDRQWQILIRLFQNQPAQSPEDFKTGIPGYFHSRKHSKIPSLSVQGFGSPVNWHSFFLQKIESPDIIESGKYGLYESVLADSIQAFDPLPQHLLAKIRPVSITRLFPSISRWTETRSLLSR